MRNRFLQAAGGGLSQVRQFYGVQDFQDTATAVSQIALTLANTWYDLTNNGLGVLSSQDQAIIGHGAIFNTLTGDFDFSDLVVGDMVFLRVDVQFTTVAPNTSVALRLAFGPAFAFTLPFHLTSHKSAVSGEDGRIVRHFPFQIKSTDTLNNPAKLQAKADGVGCSVIVNGWQVESPILS